MAGVVDVFESYELITTLIFPWTLFNPYMSNLEPFSSTQDGLAYIIENLPQIYPFDVNNKFSDDDSNKLIKEELVMRWISLTKLELEIQSEDKMVEVQKEILMELQEIIDLLLTFDLEAAHNVSDYMVRLDINSPVFWYEKGKLMFQLFVSHLIDHEDDIMDVFQKVIDLGIANPTGINRPLPFWGHVFKGNIHLYKILTGEEALEQALKSYNQGYRYAKTEELDINEEYIFDNVEIIQRILMNQFPLLVVIYNNTGYLLYEFLFQFIEVMSQDQRFIPNFTALLSAVDEHIQDLFRSPVTSSYLVMENRLLIISTLYDDKEGNWVKMAFIFSYLQQSAFNIEIDDDILSKVNEFSRQINDLDNLMAYLTDFSGRKDNSIEDQITDILHDIFSSEE